MLKLLATHQHPRPPGATRWTAPAHGSSPRPRVGTPPPQTRPSAPSRAVRNRVGTLIGLLKSEHRLEDHGARSWWSPRTRLAG